MPSTDGRVARGERTREAIVDAHADLLREGVLKPTGKLIAERAGVSLRTVWLNFKDLEALLVETTRYWLDADAALRRPVDPALPLDDRVAAHVAQRAGRHEHLAPAVRSAALGEPFSAALQAARREQVRRGVDEVASAFAPELASAGDQRDELAAALFVATSWPTWATLRDDFGLDVDAASAVVRRDLHALLDPLAR